MPENDDGDRQELGREGRSVSVQLTDEGYVQKLEELEDEHGTVADAVRHLLDVEDELSERVEELEEDRDAWREVAQNLSEKV